jgi:hypothetical protein
MKLINKLDKLYWSCRNFIRDNIFEPVWYRIFGHKHHIVKTGLPPSPWIDTDTRMLYAVMSLVEWFVENDMRIWTPNEREEELERISKEEAPEYQKDFSDCLRDQWAREDGILEIYKWWQNYSNRQELIKMALHRWSDYVEGFQKDKEDFLEFFKVRESMNEEQKAKEEMLNNTLKDMGTKLEQETQDMLKKAVELRESMWS